MFEYLMPLLVMPTYENTLLDQTCKAAVRRQIEYGKTRGVPWGISESGYNTIDVHLNYQYRAFGVPGLGLKRGLAEDLVIAPYASALALMVAPEEACINLQRLAAEGFEGRYGFYEAIDYTPSRVPRGQSAAVVRSFMAHHQGMSLLVVGLSAPRPPDAEAVRIGSVVPGDHAVAAGADPKGLDILFARRRIFRSRARIPVRPESPVRVFNSPNTPIPEVQLLSNGRYHVMVTNAGGGYSRWKDIAVTRWREDTVCDNWGTFCYIRDVKNGEFWSTAHQPTLKRRKTYEAIFSEGACRVPLCRPCDYDTHTEIAVSPEDDIELRRVTITNRSRTRRRSTSRVMRRWFLRFTGCGRPASGVQQSVRADRDCPRAAGDPLHPPAPFPRRGGPWMFHLMAVHGADIAEVSYETDRMRFIGRGNTRRGSAGDERSGRALGQQGLGAGSDRRDPVSHHAGSGTIGHGQYCHRHGRQPRSMPRACREIPGPAAWRIAFSIWRGRTARWSFASSMPRRPMRSCSAGWPAR